MENRAEWKMLLKARSGSRRRERLAEELRRADLLSFQAKMETRDRFVATAKKMNKPAEAPPQQATRDDESTAKEAPGGWFSWW